MLTAILALTALLPHSSAEDALPVALADRDLDVVLRVTDYSFEAENQSHRQQLVLLGTEELGLLTFIRLLPGVRVSYPFPHGTLTGLLVEVVALRAEAWANTGAFPLEDVRASAHGSAWIESSPTHAVAWLATRAGVEHAQPTTGLLTAAMLAASRNTAHDFALEAAAAPHVPLPRPSAKKKSKPPVIEKKPLPPV